MPGVTHPQTKAAQGERYRDRQARKRHAVAREARRPNLDADPAVVLYRAEKAKRATTDEPGMAEAQRLYTALTEATATSAKPFKRRAKP